MRAPQKSQNRKLSLGWKRAFAALASAARRFTQVPDSEHEMVLNRIAISVLIALHFAVSSFLGKPVPVELALEAPAYVAASLAFFIHTIYWPEASIRRRLTAIVVDVAALSYALFVGRELMAIYYPIYLWIIF